jgi:hypothetical protein
MSSAIAGYNAFRGENATDNENAIVLKRLQNLKPGKKTFIGKAKELTDDTGTISNVAKVGKNTFGLFGEIFKHLPWIGSAASLFGNVADGMKLFNTVKDVHDITENPKASLKVASCTLDLASIGLTGAKLISSTRLVDIGAKLASLIGKIPVVGGVVAAWTPLASIAAVVSIAKGSVDIAQSSLKIKELKKEKHGTAEVAETEDTPGVEAKLGLLDKKQAWQSVANFGAPAALKEHKIARLTKKADDLNNDQLLTNEGVADRLSRIMQNADQAAEEAKALAQGKSPLKVIKKIQAARKERQAQKAAKAFMASVNFFNQNAQRLVGLNEERLAWEELNIDEADHVKALAERKVEKYDIKLKNNRFNVAKEGVNIFLNTVLIIASIASIVFAGLAIVSGLALIPLAVAFLTVAVAGITLHFLKKRQDKATEEVRLASAPRVNDSEEAESSEVQESEEVGSAEKSTHDESKEEEVAVAI